MLKNKNILIVISHIVGWAIFLSIPFLFSPGRPPEIENEYEISFFLPIILNIFTLVLTFYVNYFYLIPKFLFKQKYFIYLIICLSFISIKLVSPILMMEILGEPHNNTMQREPNNHQFMPLVFSNSILMYIVIFLASIGLRFNNRWKELEQEMLKSKLSSLKSQINPHFLFNTLNSIYAETLGKADLASEMIIKLTEMMRYTLTESHHEKVPLQVELNYMSNYIELQNIRLASRAKLEFNIEGESENLQIAPLLLIAVIENAFKYGVNSEEDSLIKINFTIIDTDLNLIVFNKKVNLEKQPLETTGLGIKNSRKRLALIYPDRHYLNIQETENNYSVTLHIKLA